MRVMYVKNDFFEEDHELTEEDIERFTVQDEEQVIAEIRLVSETSTGEHSEILEDVQNKDGTIETLNFMVVNEINGDRLRKDYELSAKKKTEKAEKVIVEKADVTGANKMEGTTDEMKSNESGAAESELQSDNSDNACDKIESEKSTSLQEDDEAKSNSSDAVDKTRSNYGSSNNLLQETRTIEEMGTGSICEEDADAVDEPENDETDDAENSSAIELVEDDSRAAVEEREFAPPAKRIRISVETETA